MSISGAPARALVTEFLQTGKDLTPNRNFRERGQACELPYREREGQYIT
jgi:hypothetical protein